MDTRKMRDTFARPGAAACRRQLLGAAFGLAIAAGLATPASAQDYGYAAGYHAGGMHFGNLNPARRNVTVNGERPAGKLYLEPGWVLGLQGERWLGAGRAGLRFNFSGTSRPLVTPGAEDRRIGTNFADASMLLRLLPPQPDRRVAPFISAGAGFAFFGLGRGDTLVFPAADARYSGDDRLRLATPYGVGLDVITDWRWNGDPVGLRFEIVDHRVWRSPFQRLDGASYGFAHNIRLVAGAFTGFDFFRHRLVSAAGRD